MSAERTGEGLGSPPSETDRIEAAAPPLDTRHSSLVTRNSSLVTQKNPRDAKVRLAKEIVALYHSPQAAEEAERYFVETFSKKSAPVDAPEAQIPEDLGDPVPLAALISALGLAKSNSAARDLIKAGAVSLDDQKITDPGRRVTRKDLVGHLLRVGKHQFRNLISKCLE